MGYYEEQNKLFLKMIIDIVNDKKKCEFNDLVSNLAVDSGKSEDTVISKLKLLKKASRLIYKRDGGKIFICPIQQENTI